MGSTPPERSEFEGHPTANSSLPAVVDWFLGALIALGGLAAIVAGTALLTLVDRAAIEEGVDEGAITATAGTTELTAAETVDVTHAVVSWTGPGLVVTGVGMVLFAVGYVVARRRARRRTPEDEVVSSYGAFAVLGAIATAVLSFLPVSPALGGALAGYLERGESERTVSVGALAGVLPAVPLLVILVFVFGGLLSGLLAVGESGVAAVVGATLVLAALLVVTLAAGLGALGGYVGGRLAESRATTDRDGSASGRSG